MQESKRSNYSRFLAIAHQFLFPFGLVLTAGYGFYFLCLNLLSYGWQRPRSAVDFLYVWRRGTARFNDFLHLTNSSVGESFPDLGNPLVFDLAILLPLLAIGATLCFILRSICGTKLHKNALTYCAGLTVLFLMPAIQLLQRGLHFGLNFLVCCIELALFVPLRLLARRKQMSLWITLPLLIGHVTYWWIEPMTMGVRLGLHQDYPLKSVYVFVLAASIVWLLWVRQENKIIDESHMTRGIRVSAWLCAAATCLFLWFVWGPRPGYAIAHAKNRQELEIVMQRTACFGSCPVYSVRVHGNGRVEFDGQQFVTQCGKCESSITSQQLDEILQAFDRADFFALEERAFIWNSDVSSASVTITADGKTKKVRAQTWSEIGLSSQQTRFAEATKKLDAIVGTERWVGHGGRCLEGQTKALNNK